MCILFSLKKFKFGFHNTFAIDCEGEIGGLALLCKEDVIFEVLNFSVHHIHSLITIGL